MLVFLKEYYANYNNHVVTGIYALNHWLSDFTFMLIMRDGSQECLLTTWYLLIVLISFTSLLFSISCSYFPFRLKEEELSAYMHTLPLEKRCF